MQVPNGWRVRRIRSQVTRSMWLIPAVYVVVSITAALWLSRLDRVDPVASRLDLSASAASTALAALASGMIAFTGFVCSIVLLVVQFGSNQFSPRFIRWFRDDATLKHSLGTFFATFLFALVATASVGRDDVTMVPYRTLLVALALSVASVGWFIALVARTSNNLRVASVAQRLDAQAWRVFDKVYPDSNRDVRAAETAVEAMEHTAPVQQLRHEQVGLVLLAVDRESLARLAVEADAVIEFVAAVGDHVASGGLILQVFGDRAIPEQRLRSTLRFGDERTIEDDPAFTLRLLVDIAIKSLSPAVNDPTTTVQCLHRIEDVLRYAAAKHLSVGVVTDPAGRARVILPTPTWEDLVALSMDEIRAFGAGQYQVARRLRAMLFDLIDEVPEDRVPVLRRQLELLDEAIRARIPEAQRADALIADRQGLGLGQRDLPGG